MNSALELLYLIIFSGILAVAYSYLLSGQILSSSDGNEKMKDIASAIQIGAKAYLNRQYKTIAVVGILVLIIVTYSFSQNGIIGDGFGVSDWNTTDCFDSSAGSSRIFTTNSNGTGDKYFRLVTCWDGSCAVSELECPQEPFAGQDCCELNDCSTDPTFVGTVLDCTLQYCFPNIELGDGTCTDYTAAGYDGVGFNCEELNFDNGDCQGQLFSVIDNKPKYIVNKNSIGKDMLNISNMTQKYGNDYFDAISEKQKHFEYMYMYNQKIRSNRTTDRNLLGYNIFRDGTLIADSLSPGNTNFVDYEVSENTEYCYQVSAIYEDTESLSDVSCASTLGAPDAMVNFSGSAAVLNPLLSSQLISPLLSNQMNSLLRSDIGSLDIDFNLNTYNNIDTLDDLYMAKKLLLDSMHKYEYLL